MALSCLSGANAPATKAARRHVAVIGAGAFGGWTALHLLRMGARVTLVDAWGPGHARASSGGETRVIRATYGPDVPYYKLVARSLELWKESQNRWQRPLYRRTGVLWMAAEDDAYERASLPMLGAGGFAFEKLTTDEAARRFPHINFEGVTWAIHEEDAGYLLARRACAAVLEEFLKEGGQFHQQRVTPGRIAGGEMQPLLLSDGSTLAADAYVFACGPWLGRIFPGVVEITSTRQEVFYFGTPAGDSRFQEEGTPAWIDNGKLQFYGIPGNEWRGFKLADDLAGPVVDPETQERTPSPAAIQAARDYLALRFPALKDAPLIGSEVCQYEKSADGRYIADQHPEATNVWLAGGGSGHGFKNGPAFGEFVAQSVLTNRLVDPFFGLDRFNGKPQRPSPE